MKKEHSKPHDGLRCGAKTRNGTPCRQKAGWGTDHVGEGRCKLHGGKSTGPKDKVKKSKDMRDNKNGITTHERESIVFDFLDDEEKELLNQIDLDKLKQIDNEIKLVDIRLRRMMGRIQKLQLDRDEDNLFSIQNIEDAITRVQSQKLRLIESKHKLETDLSIIDETRKAQLEQIKVKTEKLKGVSSDIEDMSDLRRLLLNEGD